MSEANYRVEIFDNYNYMEGSYRVGSFESYEAALQKVKALLREQVHEFYKPGMTADELHAQFCMFGEEPVVMGQLPEGEENFSARDFAREYAEEVVKEKAAQ